MKAPHSPAHLGLGHYQVGVCVFVHVFNSLITDVRLFTKHLLCACQALDSETIQRACIGLIVTKLGIVWGRQTDQTQEAYAGWQVPPQGPQSKC